MNEENNNFNPEDFEPDDSYEESNDVNDEPETNDESNEEMEPEVKMYTQEQMESAIKGRVATFNKKLDKMKSYESTVKKLGEVTGLSMPELMNRLNSLSHDDQAKILGITPQELQTRKTTNQAILDSTQATVKLQRELEEQKLLNDPKFKDLPLFKDEIEELLEDNPKLSLRQAYTLVKGDSVASAAARDAEQRAVAKNMKSSNQVAVKSGNSGTTQSNSKLDQATVSAAKRVGMDPTEYAAYANIDNLEAYEKMLEKNSKRRK